MQREQLKILLLQIRDDHKVRAEELESFARYSQLDVNQIDVLNVFDTPSFDSSVLEGYDALYVGGASEANVLEPKIYPFCLLYTSPSPRDFAISRMPSSA